MRDILWPALAAAIYRPHRGTGGARSSTPRPINDNAYTCGCVTRLGQTRQCQPAPTTPSKVGPPSLWIPDLDSAPDREWPGFLPPGAVIKKAYVCSRAREQ
jgi:hypothetical protein